MMEMLFSIVVVLLITSLVVLSSLLQAIRALGKRVTALEQAQPDAAGPATQTPEQTAAAPAAIPAQAMSAAESAAEPVSVAPVPAPEPPPLHRPSPIEPQPVASPAAKIPPPIPENPIERALAWAWNWFLTGNVPVKVGMLVLLAGVAALLKYAGDQGWLRMPMELRLAGISLAAVGALIFAWSRRERQRTFALAMQGGAIGVLLLVVFAAVKLYAFIGPVFAFSLSVILIGAGAVLAVVQHSRTLAVLSVLAGFMAPIWLSDGSGNHVGLFTWYALFNAGIFAIAWVRPWRVLNLIGFGFTWGIGSAWGVLQYKPEHFASAQAFLLLFFAFYLLLPLLYARKQAREGSARARNGSARVDASLLFATPLIAFSLQAGLLRGEPLPLALCALALAAVYALLGWALKDRAQLRALGQGYAILAVGFATLAVPLGLSATATSTIFALEGAGLVWLGFAQQQRLTRWAGLGLQLIAALAWMLAETWMYGDPETYLPVINPPCMSGLLVALAGFAIAWLYRRAGQTRPALALYLWGLAWWVGTLWREVFEYSGASAERNWPYSVFQPFELGSFLLLFGATAWLAAEVQRKYSARALAATTCGGLLMAFLAAVLHYLDAPFAACGRIFSFITAPVQSLDCSVYTGTTGGTWVWLLFALMGARSLICLRGTAGASAWLAQLVWWLLWTAVLTLEIQHFYWHVELPGDWREAMLWSSIQSDPLPPGWRGALTIVPWLALLAAALWRWRWLRWPLGLAFDRARSAVVVAALAVIALWWLAGLTSPGGSAPLPWIALFNPLDLTQITALLLACECWRRQSWAREQMQTGWAILALAGFVLVTVMSLRAVHHWGGMPWSGSLLGTTMAQSSLTVVWGILGAAGWVIGSRRGKWLVWLGGALLLGLVLIKLLLVDRQNLGDLVGIGAVIAYALLCILIGWLAPAPPRNAVTAPEAEATA